jgi:SAM-dependent methyltransferase
VGQFEEMYRECDDPWEAEKEQYDASACSVAAKRMIHALAPERPALGGHCVVSIGCGTGRHLEWLQYPADGVELSATAIAKARSRYPSLFHHMSALNFLRQHSFAYEAYLFREVVWYLLPEWAEIVRILQARCGGALVIVELSFYDHQTYGREYFDGPDDFIAKWPFGIEKIVREHTTNHQRQGRVMIAGRVP